jgi:hypothetical protein
MPNVQIIVWHASEVSLSVWAHPAVQWIEIDLPPQDRLNPDYGYA